MFFPGGWIHVSGGPKWLAAPDPTGPAFMGRVIRGKFPFGTTTSRLPRQPWLPCPKMPRTTIGWMPHRTSSLRRTARWPCG